MKKILFALLTLGIAVLSTSCAGGMDMVTGATKAEKTAGMEKNDGN